MRADAAAKKGVGGGVSIGELPQTFEVNRMFGMVLVACLGLVPLEDPAELARTYAAAIEKVNTKHAQSPGKAREDELVKELPGKAREAFEELLKFKAADPLVEALVVAANAAAELDLEVEYERARARVEQLDVAQANKLGLLVSRERFQVRGTQGLDRKYCEHFADVLDAVLDGYDEVFGLTDFSKVPGKKLRVLVHLEASIDRPPHFAPEFPFHSQVDFPVADASGLRSPTSDGKFLFYGLCHELGHVLAMWGDVQREADHHAWAHYTGVTIVEHISREKKYEKVIDGLDDVRWRSLEKERKELAERAPDLGTREGVMAALVGLHDTVGPRAIGSALEWIESKKEERRVNRVRYFEFETLKKALLAGAKRPTDKAAIERCLP